MYQIFPDHSLGFYELRMSSLAFLSLIVRQEMALPHATSYNLKCTSSRIVSRLSFLLFLQEKLFLFVIVVALSN